MSRNQQGFSVIEALLILVIIGILGFTGLYVYHAKQSSDKSYSSTATNAQSGTTATPSTASNTMAKLIAVAKRVIIQAPGNNTANNPASASPACGNSSVSGCPFTGQFGSQLTDYTNGLNQQLDSSSTLVPSSAFMGFPQNDPIGTLSYAAAPSTDGGGTVTVTLTPSAADSKVGQFAMRWVLTMQSVNKTLLVSNITLWRGAIPSVDGGHATPACGPVQITTKNVCFMPS